MYGLIQSVYLYMIGAVSGNRPFCVIARVPHLLRFEKVFIHLVRMERFAFPGQLTLNLNALSCEYAKIRWVLGHALHPELTPSIVGGTACNVCIMPRFVQIALYNTCLRRTW